MSLPVLDPHAPVPKLCLNMIVKNESKIIKRLLSTVSELIDCYCICDTGSTDNTIELIEEFFQEKGIPGKVIEEPFQDFGYNRSYALKACESMDADYVLLLDADMVFWRNTSISPDNFKRYLNHFDLFYIFQGTEAFYYKNTRIVKNKMGFSYWGVTHEYVNSPPNARSGQLDKDVCFIKDIGDGGSKANKFMRDVALLKKGLEQEPNNDRYTFYLANSLKDSGQKQEAINTYKKRIELGGWIEEVWHSYYTMGKCHQEMGNMDSAICAWMEAYDAFPNRIENLHEIIQYYRVIGKHKLAQRFYEMAHQSRTDHPERDYLFMQKDVYDYKLDYEMTIFGYYYNPKEVDLAKLSMNVIAYPHVDEGIARNILSNYKFYSSSLVPKDNQSWMRDGLGDVLSKIGSLLEIPSAKYPHFVSSTPTFVAHPTDANRMYVMVRFVNYHINDEGGYENHEYIETKNVMTEIERDAQTNAWKVVKESFLDYDSSFDNRYVGLEDVRMMVHGGKIFYNANRGLPDGRMAIEHGQIHLSKFKTEEVAHLEFPVTRQIEKNWVMFTDGDDLRMVYNWHPMILGKIERKTKFVQTQSIETPYFFKHVRGSTNGVRVGNEVWFMCHVVSYEDRRYYYHIMVMLNTETHTIRYTKMFTFGKEKVEYTLGMIYREEPDELWIGYSVMDKETKYVSVDTGVIRSLIMRS